MKIVVTGTRGIPNVMGGAWRDILRSQTDIKPSDSRVK